MNQTPCPHSMAPTYRQHATEASSEVVLDERQRREHLDLIVNGFHKLAWLGALWDALADGCGQVLHLRLALDSVVLLHALQEHLVATGFPQMLEADVDALAELLVRHAILGNFCDLNADGVPVNVEDDTSPPVVEAVRHALLDGGVNDDIDVVPALEGRKVPRRCWHALGLVVLRVLVARAVPVAPGLRAKIPHGRGREAQARSRLDSAEP